MIWTKLNREFMAGEIKDNKLWNDTDKADNDQFEDTFFKALKSKELISLMIFEEDGEPIGFANLMHIFSIWAHGKALVIDDLYLRIETRGKGYGRLALGFIEEYAEKTGCNRLQFQSEVTNPDAMKFYMAMGYQPADMKFYVRYFI